MNSTIYLILIMISVFVFVLAFMLTVTSNERATQKRLNDVLQQKKKYMNDNLEKSFSDRYFSKIKDAFFLAASKSANQGHGKVNSKDKKYQMVAANLKVINSPLSPEAFITIKNIVTIIGMLLGVIVGFVVVQTDILYQMCICMAFIIVFMLAPSKILSSKANKRRDTLLMELPTTIDLINVAVEAGLGLDQAIIKLYSKNQGSPLMTELMTSVKDVQMGLSRKQAFAGVCDRCQVQELSTFCAAVVQAEELGVSVKAVLSSQAISLREERKQRAERSAAKAPVKMLIPTICLIFPCVFMVVLGPTVISMLDSGIL